jgi:hypothetical protein
MSQSLKKSHKQSSTDAEKPRKKARSVTPTITEENEEETKETPPSPKPEITLISGDDDDIFASVNVDEEKDKAAAVGAMWTSAATVSSSTEMTPWAGVADNTMLIQIGGPLSVWQELAHMIGCRGIYITESGMERAHITAKAGDDKPFGNEFASLMFNPIINKTWIHKGGRDHAPANVVMLPPIIISGGYGPPHGNIDEDPTPAKGSSNLPARPKLANKWEAKISYALKPQAWCRFSTTEDGAFDIHALGALQVIKLLIEPRIKRAMEAANLGAETWSSCTCAKSDITSHGLWPSAKILVKPTVGTWEKDAEKVAIKKKAGMELCKGEYKASTKMLTRYCKDKVLYEQKKTYYRMTSARERKEDPNTPLVVALTHEQSCVKIVGHLAMFAIEFRGLRKGATFHPQALLHSYVWMGPPEAYADMTALTTEQILAHVPDFPEAPTPEELWNRAPEYEEIKNYNQMLEAFTAKREREG